MRRLELAMCMLLATMFFASALPASAQVQNATVKIDGMI